jgi:hypothetical protein
MLAGRWSYHGHDGRAILIGCWGCGAPGQESPPLVLLVDVLLVWHCPSVHIAPIFPAPAMTLKSGARVIGIIPHQLRSSIDPLLAL